VDDGDLDQPLDERSDSKKVTACAHSGHHSGRVVGNTFQRKILLLCLTEMVFCISRFNGCSMRGLGTREKLWRVELFPCIDAQLLPDTLELFQISLVLLLVLDLLPDTFKDPNRGRVVVNTASSAEGSLDDRRRGD